VPESRPGRSIAARLKLVRGCSIPARLRLVRGWSIAARLKLVRGWSIAARLLDDLASETLSLSWVQRRHTGRGCD
jgi:hypothetical protein